MKMKSITEGELTRFSTQRIIAELPKKEIEPKDFFVRTINYLLLFVLVLFGLILIYIA